MIESTFRKWHFRSRDFENFPGPRAPPLPINKILNYAMVKVLGWIRACRNTVKWAENQSYGFKELDETLKNGMIIICNLRLVFNICISQVLYFFVSHIPESAS